MFNEQSKAFTDEKVVSFIRLSSHNSRALIPPILSFFQILGAAVGPLLAGIISSTGWQNVFYMLGAANLLAFVVSAQDVAFIIILFINFHFLFFKES